MRIDAVEAFTNAAVGLLVSWAATTFLLGYSPAQAVGVTLLFFALSFARAWALRALFRRLGHD
jgi:hypothetical protein